MSRREITLQITDNMDGRQVKGLLRNELHMASSLISRVKLRENGICLNGIRVRTSAVVHSGDILSADISDISPFNPAPPMEYPLRIVYEDEDLAIVDKPAGMAVHGSYELGGITVANALSFIWGQKVSFHPVSRLDKGTSGLMAIAKSGYIHDRLRRCLHTDDFTREYIAVAEGTIRGKRLIDKPISPIPAEGTRRVCMPDGLPSRTYYEVIASSPELTLLRVRPLTGRTHQIRVHFSDMGHPLAGDVIYGGSTSFISRPALHSAHIEMVHPITGCGINVSSNPPEDISSLVYAKFGIEEISVFG